MTWLGRVATLLSVAAVSSCMTWLWIELKTFDEKSNPPPVPLTSDLPREIVKMSPAFDEKVKARFPVGTPIAAMGSELRQQEFMRWDWSDLPGQEHHAVRYDGGGFCKSVALVYWRSDENDRLTSIRGEYQVTCL